jgi:hypothetical protein
MEERVTFLEETLLILSNFLLCVVEKIFFYHKKIKIVNPTGNL